MSDDDERSVPDLGYFAGRGGGQSQFGGQSQVGGQSQFGGQSQVGGQSQFGGQSRFGGQPAAGAAPAAPAPFGAPGAFGAPRPAAPAQLASPRSSRPTSVLVAVAVAGLLVLVAGVVGGRFAWSQFFADPVVPATLQGMPRATDAASTAQLQAAQQQVTGLLSDGSEAEIALYTDGQSTAYVLMSVRGSLEDFDAADDIPAPFTKSSHGKVSCGAVTAQATGGPGLTICVRGFYRRAVVLYAVSATGGPDAATVARATEEAWDAQ